MTPMIDPYTDWDGAYVLGALSLDERHEYETHLATCPACSAAVSELAGLPGILTKLDSSSASALLDEPKGEYVPELEFLALQAVAARAKARSRRSFTFKVLGSAAASVVFLLAGLVIGQGNGSITQLFSSHSGAKSTFRTVAMVGVAPTAIAIDLQVTPKNWGTKFTWDCRYNPALESANEPNSYELVAIDKRGNSDLIASWKATDTDVLGMAATSKFAISDISYVEVRGSGQKKPILTGTI